MLKLSIIIGFIAPIIICRGTPINCRQTTSAGATASSTTTMNPKFNMNELYERNIENYMDKTVKPCENFYKFACGNWNQQYIDQLDFEDILGQVDFELNRKLEHLLKRIGNSFDAITNANTNNTINANNGNNKGATMTTTTTTSTTLEAMYNSDEFYATANATNIYQKVHDYYKSCKRVKPYNLKKYLLLIQPDINLNWYILSRNGGRDWPIEQFNWLQVIAKLRLYGLNGVLLKEDVLPRWDETTSNSIYLDKPNLIDTKPMGEAPMIELMLDIGQTKRIANAVARDVHNFEQQLHKLQEIDDDDDGAKEMQLSYLQEYMPQIDWQSYLETVRGPMLSLKTTIIIQNIPYMRALYKLINNIEKQTLCNYIMLKFLKFLKEQGPTQITKIDCIASLRRVMPLAMSYIIGNHYYYKDAKHNDMIIQDIFHNLKMKFYEIVNDNRLQLKQPIVNALLQKINYMQLQIGYAPRNLTIEYYNNYYERISLDANNFYANQLSLLRFAVEKTHESLSYTNEIEQNDTNDIYLLINLLGSSSSPFYVKPRNRIVIPYGYLQMPIYQRHLHMVFKYAKLGFAIAHELLHGFDSNGIDYDHLGNIMGPSEEISANQRFLNGLKCMQNELATGSRSLNEKLTDYEGIRLVYETYFQHYKHHHHHHHHHHHQHSNKTNNNNNNNNNNNSSSSSSSSTTYIKNSNETNSDNNASSDIKLLKQYTIKQLFFITYAQQFCGTTHRGIKPLVIDMEHDIDELRVLQTLANYNEFSKAFDCERRSKMQSRNRCRLW